VTTRPRGGRGSLFLPHGIVAGCVRGPQRAPSVAPKSAPAPCALRQGPALVPERDEVTFRDPCGVTSLRLCISTLELVLPASASAIAALFRGISRLRRRIPPLPRSPARRCSRRGHGRPRQRPKWEEVRQGSLTGSTSPLAPPFSSAPRDDAIAPGWRNRSVYQTHRNPSRERAREGLNTPQIPRDEAGQATSLHSKGQREGELPWYVLEVG